MRLPVKFLTAVVMSVVARLAESLFQQLQRHADIAYLGLGHQRRKVFLADFQQFIGARIQQHPGPLQQAFVHQCRQASELGQRRHGRQLMLFKKRRQINAGGGPQFASKTAVGGTQIKQTVGRYDHLYPAFTILQDQ